MTSEKAALVDDVEAGGRGGGDATFGMTVITLMKICVGTGVLAVPHDSINTGGTRGQEGTYTVAPPSTLVNVWKHECARGVLRCRGAFTLLLGLVAIRRGRGWFCCRI